MLEIKGISKSFKNNTLLDNVSIEFGNRGLVVITGESGCGKTTLLNIISGLDIKYSGEVLINSKKCSKNGNIHKEIAYLCQNDILLDNKTGYENLVEVFKTKKIKDVDNKISKLIGIVKLDSILMSKEVKYLSSGEKKRLSIAVAIAGDSSILLLDEPTEKLDIDNANNIYSILSKISEDKLVILVTHDIKNAINYANKVVLISNGNATLKVINGSNIEPLDIMENNYQVGKKKTKHLKIDYMYIFYLFYSFLLLLIFSNINIRIRPKNIELYPKYYYLSDDELNNDSIGTIAKNDDYDFFINTNNYDYYADYTNNYKKLDIVKGSNIKNESEIIISTRLNKDNSIIYNIGQVIKIKEFAYEIVGIFNSDKSVVLIDKEKNKERLINYYSDYNFEVSAVNDGYYSSYYYLNYCGKNINPNDDRLNTKLINEFLLNNEKELKICLYVPVIILCILFLLNLFFIFLSNSSYQKDFLFYIINGAEKKKIRLLLFKKLYIFPFIIINFIYLFAYILSYIIINNDKQIYYMVNTYSFIMSYLSSLSIFIILELRNIICLNANICGAMKTV